jgi:predicted nucleotidyltransferase
MLDGSSKGRRPFAVSGELRERVLSQLKAALEARREVLLAVAFGSFVERSLARDVDVAVYLPGCADILEAAAYAEGLSRELSKLVGLPVDVVVLNFAGEGLLMRAMLKGRPLVVKDLRLATGLYLLALEVRNVFVLGEPK